MQNDWNNPPEQQPTAESEATLAVDLQGIPILNEVVEPDELSASDDGNPDQADLPLLASASGQSIDPDAVNMEAVREALRNELLGVIEQTAATLAERFREDLQQSLREELTRALDERLLQSIHKEHDSYPK
ncbi:hypothetical protein [Sedimenticola sp.]|uniref:hypothetical protein n=1 Tax=Sedimenticola sp. TaxID=1940285 RepID=UPI003D0E8CC0